MVLLTALLKKFKIFTLTNKDHFTDQAFSCSDGLFGASHVNSQLKISEFQEADGL